MGKRKRLWVPYEPYDFGAIQEWLEDKAREGYELYRMKPYFAVFEETENKNLKYHLEPTGKDSAKPEDEILESRKERGWTYAGTITDHFHVFRAPEGTQDFYTEGQSLRRKLEEKLKKEKRSLLWQIPLLILTVLLQVGFMSSFQDTIIWMIESLSLFQFIVLVPLFFGALSQYMTYRHHKRMLEKLDGIDDVFSDSTVNYRMLGFLGRGLFSAAVVFIGISFILESSGNSSLGSITKIDQYPFIHIEEIELKENPSISESEYIKYYNHAGSSKSLFLEEKLYLYQNANIGHVEHYYSDLTAVYYKLKSEQAADLMSNELRKRAEDSSDVDGTSETHLGYSTTHYDGTNVQYLILSDSSQILELKYYGDADLSEWREDFANKLNTYNSTIQ